jgi:hypothetical protein
MAQEDNTEDKRDIIERWNDWAKANVPTESPATGIDALKFCARLMGEGFILNWDAVHEWRLVEGLVTD